MPEPLSVEDEVRQLFVAKLRESAVFCRSFRIEDKDLDEWARDHSEEYLRGYNAGLSDGVEGALACFVEENGY